MGEVAGRRMTAEIDGDFVVFLIGARFDKLHLARSLVDLGGRRGMKHMLDYLVAHPDKGLLAYEMGLPTIVQYWRSFEQLEAFAKDKDDPHVGRVAPVLAASGTERPDRHLARDLPGEGGTVRGRLRKHASARLGQSGAAAAGVGVLKRSRTAWSARVITRLWRGWTSAENADPYERARTLRSSQSPGTVKILKAGTDAIP